MNSEYNSPVASLFQVADQQSFFCDHPAYAGNWPDGLSINPQFGLLNNRLKLREFCQAGKFLTPAFFAADQFARLSAWAVKQNRFPMAMKSAINLADGTASFVLKAFRELPEFFEQINSRQAGAVLLEEFIMPKARVEITWLNGSIRLIAQFGLDKSMRLRQSWRAFPAKVPENLLQQLSEICRHFADLLAVKGLPLRFSFAISSRGPVLLALNCGFNWPEYHPDWRTAAGLPPLESTEVPDNGRMCRVLNFYDMRPGDVDAAALKKSAGETLAAWAVSQGQAMLLLSSENAATLQEGARRVEALFKHLAD